MDLISFSYIVFTVEGIEEFTNIINQREERCSLRKVNRDTFKLEDPADGIDVNFDLTKVLDIKTRSLRNFFEKKDEYLLKLAEQRRDEEMKLATELKDKKEKTDKKKREVEIRRERKAKRMMDRKKAELEKHI